MKLIGIHQAGSGLVGAAEEITPVKGVDARELVRELVKRYKPTATPGIQEIQPGGPITFPPFVFNAGTLDSDGKKANFSMLQVMPHIVGVQATSTEDADIVLDDVIAFLNEKFDFRITDAAIKRKHITIAIVEFDPKFSDGIEKLKQIQSLLEKLMPGDKENEPLFFKRLAFGRYSPSYDPSQNWETMNLTDFSIESRVGFPLSQNRFFCAAPLATKAFLESLRSVERILLGKFN